jgi:hypothetical protein
VTTPELSMRSVRTRSWVSAESLLEPPGLALGLGMVRLAVLLPDAQAAQFRLQAVAAAFAAR